MLAPIHRRVIGPGKASYVAKKLRRRARNVVSRRRLLLALKSPAPSDLAGSTPSRCDLVHNLGRFFQTGAGFGPASPGPYMVIFGEQCWPHKMDFPRA